MSEYAHFSNIWNCKIARSGPGQKNKATLTFDIAYGNMAGQFINNRFTFGIGILNGYALWLITLFFIFIVWSMASQNIHTLLTLDIGRLTF